MKGKFFSALASVLLGTVACTLPNPPPQIFLPPGAVGHAGSSSTAFSIYRYKVPSGAPSSIALIDAFDRGLDDILVSVPGNSSVALFKNRGDGSFKFYKNFASCAGGDALDAENLMGDGHQDFTVNCPSDSRLAFFRGNGKGDFSRQDILVGQSTLSVQGAPNTDKAGSPYLAVLRAQPSGLDLLYNHGGAVFIRERTLQLPALPTQLLADIFTPDEAVSYAVVGQQDSFLSVFLKQRGEFARRDYKTVDSPSSATTYFPVRGVANIVVASSTQNSFRVYANDGHGDFIRQKDFSLPTGSAGSVSVAHLRGRPVQELIFQSALTSEIAMYPDHGDLSFSRPEIIKPGAGLSGLSTGHFAHKSDGMDMAFIDAQNGELVILLNERLNY